MVALRVALLRRCARCARRVAWLALLLRSNRRGFLAHSSDGEPGVKTIWRGLRRLDGITTS